MRPIIMGLDDDRRKVAEINSKQDRVTDRLQRLEFTLGLNDKKPQIFEDIENKVAEVKSDLAISVSESNYRVSMCDARIETLERDLNNLTTEMKAIESFVKLRDVETARANS